MWVVSLVIGWLMSWVGGLGGLMSVVCSFGLIVGVEVVLVASLLKVFLSDMTIVGYEEVFTTRELF